MVHLLKIMLILIHTYDNNASTAVNIDEMITIRLTNSTINYITCLSFCTQIVKEISRFMSYVFEFFYFAT